MDINEPPIREFADRGVIWLLEFPPNMGTLLRLAAAELADNLDFAQAERINRIDITTWIRIARRDGLFGVIA